MSMNYSLPKRILKVSWVEKALFLSLGLLAFTLPFDGYNVLGLGSLFRFIGFIVLAMFVSFLLVSPKLARNAVQTLRNGASYALLLFVFWSGVTILWAPNVDWATTRFVSYLSLLGITFAIASLPLALVARLWVAIVLGVIISLPLGFILPHPNPLLAESGRFSSGGKDPNDYANLALIAFLVCYFGALAYMAWRFKYILSLASWIAVIAVPLSGSRSALVNALFNLGLGLLKRGRRGILLLIFVGVIGPAGLFALSETPWIRTFLERAETLGNLSSEDTWAGRWDIWRAAWYVFTEHPLGGVGVANFAWVSPQYSDMAAHIAAMREDGGGGVAHNMFLSVLAETGIVGFFFFVLLQATLFHQLWRKRKKEPLAWGLLLGFVAYWIAGMSLTWEYVKIAFFLYGSALSLAREER